MAQELHYKKIKTFFWRRLEMKKQITLKIKYNKEWQEYCVTYMEDGIKNENKSYYTDNKQDAQKTLELMKTEHIHLQNLKNLTVVKQNKED